MTKKNFIELANYVRAWNNGWQGDMNGKFSWEQIGMLADFCAAQNPSFNRQRWLAYIAGEVGQNGGKVR